MQSQSIIALVKGLPKKYSEVGFKNFIDRNDNDKEAKSKCLEFIKQGGKGMFFCGAVGTGKTHLAFACLRNMQPIPTEGGYLRRCCSSILNADEFFMMLNDAIAERKSKLEIIKSLFNDNDVFCLDDLGTKNFTEAKQENLYALVNHAYLNEKKIIITTNFTLDDIARFDERISSRIVEMCDVIMLTGKDYRLSKQK